jgi:transcriptional regulator with XRE-family HTH domain
MPEKRGRKKGPAERVRELRHQGWKVSEIAEELGIGERSVSRYLNAKQDGAQLEDHIRQGEIEKAHAQIPVGAGERIGETTLISALQLDELLKLGVPTDEAPFILASWDSARWEGRGNVIEFWNIALGFLKEDPSTPWDVCIDLALARATASGWGSGIDSVLVDLLWRYKPWRGRANARAYINVIRSGLWEKEIPVQTVERSSQRQANAVSEEPMRITARDLYVLSEQLPKRLINNYVEKPLGFPMSLLMRGRKKEPPIHPKDALQIADHFLDQPNGK